jgi:hypothetical protein
MRWRSERRTGRDLLAIVAGLAAAAGCHAGGLRFCDDPPALNATQQDRLLRFAAVVKDELERSGRSVALIARSGLDLSRFGVRYSHAGLSLKANRLTPWSVRQLYYACNEGRPRLFDQGVAGFLSGTDDPVIGYASVVLLPPGREADELERAALDDRRALQLLGADYSANAHAFAVRYQNCNQWVMELLALAWGRLDGDGTASAGLRTRAQRWLQEQAYVPTRFEVNALWMWAGAFVPWLHHDDHPRDDVANAVYRVSMPAAIDAFVRARVPGATRLEFCHTERHVVVRRGWSPIAPGCNAERDDTVIPLDEGRPRG